MAVFKISDLPQRFQVKIIIDPVTECWVWIGYKLKYGHGRISIGNKKLLTHRVSYLLLKGPIPSETPHLDHLCRNPPCCNPEHLEPVTNSENVKRGDAGRHFREKTHCPQGHLYSIENTLLYNGGRNCRICKNTQSSKWQKERRKKRKLLFLVQG